MAARNPFASSIPDAFDPYSMIGSRPGRLSTGYYFIRNLLIVGGIVGGLVAAYRNDVFRDLARKVGQEQRYLSTEKLLFGTPGWGTPRSMEPVLAETATAVSGPAAPVATQAEASQPAPTSAAAEAAPARAPEPPPAAAPAPAPEHAAAPVAVAQQVPAAVAAPQAAPPPAAPPQPAAKPIDPLAPVSFDSLPKAGQPVSFNALPAAAPAPAPVARAAAPAPAARPAPAPVDRSKAKAIRVSLDETPAPGSGRSIPAPRPAAAAPPPEPAAAPSLPEYMQKPPPSKVKTTDVHKNDNPLMAAVRGAVRARPANPKDTVPAAQ